MLLPGITSVWCFALVFESPWGWQNRCDSLGRSQCGLHGRPTRRHPSLPAGLWVWHLKLQCLALAFSSGPTLNRKAEPFEELALGFVFVFPHSSRPLSQPSVGNSCGPRECPVTEELIKISLVGRSDCFEWLWSGAGMANEFYHTGTWGQEACRTVLRIRSLSSANRPEYCG